MKPNWKWTVGAFASASAILKQRLKTVERTRALQRKERDRGALRDRRSGRLHQRREIDFDEYADASAGVFVEDKLFATLDPTTRALRLPNGDKMMIVDTVGFINKIPHALIEAFKSTLEEVCRADLLLHLVDMANPLFEEQIRVIEKCLEEIGAGEIPTVLVPNKVDLAPTPLLRQLENKNVLDVCAISALKGTGVKELLETIGKILDLAKEQFHACLGPGQGEVVALLRERGRIVEESYEGNLIHVTAMVTPKLAGQVRKLLKASALHGERLS